MRTTPRIPPRLRVPGLPRRPRVPRHEKQRAQAGPFRELQPLRRLHRSSDRTWPGGGLDVAGCPLQNCGQECATRPRLSPMSSAVLK